MGCEEGAQLVRTVDDYSIDNRLPKRDVGDSSVSTPEHDAAEAWLGVYSCGMLVHGRGLERWGHESVAGTVKVYIHYENIQKWCGIERADVGAPVVERKLNAIAETGTVRDKCYVKRGGPEGEAAGIVHVHTSSDN